MCVEVQTMSDSNNFNIDETPESITIVFSSTMKNIDRTCDETLRFLMNIFKDFPCPDSVKKECKKEQNCSDCLKSHLFAIQLVMREGLTNAVRHGNALNPYKKVKCNVRINRQSIVNLLLHMEIEDQGNGFDWREEQKFKNLDEASEHGRGLMIMEQYVSRYWYNESGNKLTLEKSISLK